MDSLVFVAVLFAAAAHAGWNAAIKRGLDPLVTTVLIAVGAGVVALPIVAWLGLPAAAARPWVVASVIVHLGYFAGLIEAYRAGDLGQVEQGGQGSEQQECHGHHGDLECENDVRRRHGRSPRVAGE